MKKPLFILLFCLMALSSKSQSGLVKIYFVKNGAQTLGPLEVYTTLSADKPIIVRNNSYTLLETDVDSIGFIPGVSFRSDDYQTLPPKPKPVFIPFERGKAYFFKMGPITYSSHLDVEEMTERAFWLYVGLNKLNTQVKRYFLSGSGGLSKRQ